MRHRYGEPDMQPAEFMHDYIHGKGRRDNPTVIPKGWLFVSAVGMLATAFLVGRQSVNEADLVQENKKLQESVSILRGEKLGVARGNNHLAVGRIESTDRTSATGPGSITSPPVPMMGKVIEVDRPDDDPAAMVFAQRTDEAIAVDEESPPMVKTAAPEVPARSKKTRKVWTGSLGDGIQGNATYWTCNNSTLRGEGMLYNRRK